VVLTPSALAKQVLDQASDGVHTAILFGREDFGLSKADVLRCEALVRVPTPEHASLNLAQAVLLICWQLFQEASSRGATYRGRTLGGSRAPQSTALASQQNPRDGLADVVNTEPAVTDIVDLLHTVGYTRSVQPDKVRLTVREAFQRAKITVRQTQALRGMMSRVIWALRNPDSDWQAPRRRS